MIKDITIGQYISGNSPIHKMDARLKIIAVFVYIIILLLIKNPVSYLMAAVCTATVIMVSGISPKHVLRGLKPMTWILLFTAVLNLFLTKGTVLISIPLFKFSLKITYEGVYTAVIMALRLSFLMIGSSLLTLTTSPLQLTDGMEKLMKPLEKIKVPAHEIAMMMSIALRFIPTLSEETEKIMKAQKARGADFETGNIIARAKAMLPILVPLFVSAFRRADELATAMEARCYRGGEGRTKMKESRITPQDIRLCVIFAVGMAIIVAAELLIEI